MTLRARLLVLLVALGGAVFGAAKVYTAAPVPNPKDELRYLPIDNSDIFHTMGARTLKLHVPADQLKGKSQFVLKMAENDQAPRKLFAVSLQKSRKESDPLDVTFVMFLDSPRLSEVKWLQFSLSSNEFYRTFGKGNPLPGFNVTGTPHALGDLAKGIEMGDLVKVDNDTGKEEKVVFSLWLE